MLRLVDQIVNPRRTLLSEARRPNTFIRVRNLTFDKFIFKRLSSFVIKVTIDDYGKDGGLEAVPFL